jgi:aspartyl-tRNA(Asn)/glutamyl-tRNA(Gln) amidotransferase subunit A
VSANTQRRVNERIVRAVYQRPSARRPPTALPGEPLLRSRSEATGETVTVWDVQTLTEQVRAVASGATTSVALVEEALAGAERVQPVLNAFTHVLADDALAQAKALDAHDDPVGPLHGVPIAVKDLYDVAGLTTTGCCAAYDERAPADEDCVVVAKLRAAGAVIVAKTNQHELACGATTLISSRGPCLNPWDTARIPGGSSGGSGAAVGAGVVAMAMGSDTGGSIRIPSSFCGNTGLKPTHGAVSLRGAMPMCPSLDTAGPLARSAEDCALVHSVLVGYDPAYLWSRAGSYDPPSEADGIRVGIPRSYFALVDSEVRVAVEQASSVLESLGMTVVEVEGPDIGEAWGTFGTRLAEIAHCYRDLWDDDRITPNLAGMITIGRQLTAADAFAGREVELRVRRSFARDLDAADVLLAPCTVFPAPKIDDTAIEVEGGKLDVHAGGCARLTLPVNVAGLPALALPIGFSSAGTPIGGQLIGNPWSEAFLCAVGAAYQRETDWHTSVAPVR